MRLAVILSVLMLAAPAAAQPAAGWSSLVADRAANSIGDSLTVVIYQNASASNSAQRGSRKATRLAGSASTGPGDTHRAELDLAGTFDGTGQTSRADRIVASISVLVTDVLPSGDLRIEGQQTLRVNGERTVIRVSGRVRPSDIGRDNTVLSTRLAEADIAYDGAGFAARSARPGLIGRVLSLF